MVLLVLLRPMLASALLLNGGTQGRRVVLEGLFTTVLAPSVGGGGSQQGRESFLTSRPLERLRIQNQEAVDNRVYGGELADPLGQPRAPALLLIPIVQMEAEIRWMEQSAGDAAAWPGMLNVLSQAPYTRKEFKAVFNAFADNIYYSDVDRANLYLGGGATPSSTQTTQYMLRNEILTSLEGARDELAYLVSESEPSTPRNRSQWLQQQNSLQANGKVVGESQIEIGTEVDDEDLKELLRRALAAFDEYLSLPPGEDVELARKAGTGTAASSAATTTTAARR